VSPCLEGGFADYDKYFAFLMLGIQSVPGQLL
jgi:hypothetical protein